MLGCFKQIAFYSKKCITISWTYTHICIQYLRPHQKTCKKAHAVLQLYMIFVIRTIWNYQKILRVRVHRHLKMIPKVNYIVWTWNKSHYIFYLAFVMILFEIELWKYVWMFRHCVNIAVSFMLLRIRKCLLLENAHLAYLRMIKVNVQHLICIKDVCVCMCVCQNIKYKHDKLFIKTRKPHAN